MNDLIKKEEWSDGLIRNLVDKIREGRVVPIIGSGAYEVEGYNSVQEYVVDTLANQRLSKDDVQDCLAACSMNGIKGMTMLDYKFAEHKTNLKVDLKNFFSKEGNYKRIKLKKEVGEFLSNGSFPLILTTCFYEMLSKVISCYNLRYTPIQYKRDNANDQDIPENIERSPTIFHLFGNLSTSDTTYMVNESDLLKYIHSYLGPQAPARLKHYLKNRYMLTLGCEIPDWTFRFMLYSLKDGNLLDTEGASNSFVGGAVATSKMEMDLSSFLDSIKYQCGNDVKEVLRHIIQKLTPQTKPNLFLSMSSKDYKIYGTVIYNKLSKLFNVWFYPNQEDSQYWDKIEDGIRICDFFMPVVTDSALVKIYKVQDFTTIEKDQSTGLLYEWKLATEKYLREIGKRKYSVPFYLVNIKEENFPNELANRDPQKNIIYPLFFPESGAEGLPVSNVEELTPEIVWNHLKLEPRK